MLQEKLSSHPVLALYNPRVHTDASSYGYGAVLMQRQQDDYIHPVMYFNRRITAAESHSYELETFTLSKDSEFTYRAYPLWW